MAHKYYCEKCNKVYESVVRRDDFKCPNCKLKTREVDEDGENKNEETLPSSTSSDSKNQTGIFLNTLGGFMIVLSIIGGIVIALGNGIIIGAALALYGSFDGILVSAVGEVINLLQDIKNK